MVAKQRLVVELLKIAEHSGDDVHEVQARHAAWGGPFDLRQLPELDHIDRALAVYDPARHAATARFYGGHDAGVCGLSHAATSLWSLGYPERAMDRYQRAIDLAALAAASLRN